MLDQARRRHFDHRFGRGNAPDRRACDPHGEKPRHHLISKKRQLFRLDRSRDHQIGDPVPPGPATHVGFFSVFRQCRDGVDRGLHIIRGARHVPPRFKIERDRGAAFA